jgi:hypothetical protein
MRHLKYHCGQGINVSSWRKGLKHVVIFLIDGVEQLLP